MVSSTVTVELNEAKILAKVNNAEFGLFLANEWKRLINPYTPKRHSGLERLVELRPFEIEYKQPYSRYIYYGKLMVDPLTKSAWSRPNVKKELTDIDLKYRTDSNPFATHHWDKAAEQAGQKEKLIKAANAWLKNRGV